MKDNLRHDTSPALVFFFAGHMAARRPTAHFSSFFIQNCPKYAQTAHFLTSFEPF